VPQRHVTAACCFCRYDFFIAHVAYACLLTAATIHAVSLRERSVYAAPLTLLRCQLLPGDACSIFLFTSHYIIRATPLRHTSLIIFIYLPLFSFATSIARESLRSQVFARHASSPVHLFQRHGYAVTREMRYGCYLHGRIIIAEYVMSPPALPTTIATTAPDACRHQALHCPYITLRLLMSQDYCSLIIYSPCLSAFRLPAAHTLVATLRFSRLYLPPLRSFPLLTPPRHIP